MEFAYRSCAGVPYEGPGLPGARCIPIARACDGRSFVVRSTCCIVFWTLSRYRLDSLFYRRPVGTGGLP